MDSCDILHLLIYDWNNMELMLILYQHEILFLLLIGFTDVGTYFLRYLSPINNFPSAVLVAKMTPSEIGNIISLCVSRNEIWSECFCLFIWLPLFFTDNEYFTFEECITWQWFSIQEFNSLTYFSENIFS